MIFSLLIKKYNSGFIPLLLASFWGAFTFAFIPLFFRNHGFPLYSLFFIFMIFNFVAVIACSVINKYNIKKFISVGFFLNALMAAILLFSVGYFSMIVYASLFGLTMAFFWIPLNYLFFEQSFRNHSGVNSSIYQIMAAGLGIIIPPFGALVIENFSYTYLFRVSIVGLIISAYVCYKVLPDKTYIFTLCDSFKNYKSLKTITLFEGAHHILHTVVIPIYTLIFLQRELSFGIFTSYIALVGLVVGFIISYFSDKQQRRKSYIYTLFAFMVLTTSLLALANTTTYWVIAVGLYLVVSTISFPIRLAMTMDVKKVDLGFWKAREILLNAGRLIILSIVIVLFYLEIYWAVFMVFALISIIYPFLVKKKLKNLK
jgi:MFS family permease